MSSCCSSSASSSLLGAFQGDPADRILVKLNHLLYPSIETRHSGQHLRSTPNPPHTRSQPDSLVPPTRTQHHIMTMSPRQAPQILQSIRRGMSNLLQTYQVQAWELLYHHTPESSPYSPLSPTPYLDLRVLCQDHPLFHLYLLMSAPYRFLCAGILTPDSQQPRTYGR